MKRISKKIRSNSGESLIELLISILMVAVVVAGLCNAIVIANRINKMVDEAGEGVMLDAAHVKGLYGTGAYDQLVKVDIQRIPEAEWSDDEDENIYKVDTDEIVNSTTALVSVKKIVSIDEKSGEEKTRFYSFEAGTASNVQS